MKLPGMIRHDHQVSEEELPINIGGESVSDFEPDKPCPEISGERTGILSEQRILLSASDKIYRMTPIDEGARVFSPGFVYEGVYISQVGITRSGSDIYSR